MTYVTICYISEACMNKNTRGEGDGVVPLASSMTGDVLRSHVSSPSQRRGERKGIEETVGSDKVFRHDFRDNPCGLTFGPEERLHFKVAVRDIVGPKGRTKNALKDFYDGEFGGMIPKDNSKDGDFGSVRSSICTSTAFSTTEFGSDVSFHTAPHPDEKKAGSILPYHEEFHTTRYSVRQSFNLDDYRDAMHHFIVQLAVFVRGFRPGGGHARNEFFLRPEALMWRFTKTAGTTGLNHTMYMTPIDKDPDLTYFVEQAMRHDQTFSAAGRYTYDETLAPDFSSLLTHDNFRTAEEQIREGVADQLGMTTDAMQVSVDQAIADGLDR